jgi:hypothetical protein
MEDAVKSFNSALESGDAAKVRAAMPDESALAAHLDCGKDMSKMLDETATTIVGIDDVKAIKGTHASFEKLDTTDAKVIPAGPFEGSCKVTKEFKQARVTATWKLENAPHTTKLTLAELGGRWYVIDVPGI